MQEKMVYVPYEDFVEMVKALEKVEILGRLAAEESNYISVSDVARVLGKGIKDEAD